MKSSRRAMKTMDSSTWTGGPTLARKCEVIPAPALSRIFWPSGQTEKGPPRELVGETSRIDRRRAAGIHLDDGTGNRLVSGAIGNGRLHYEDSLPLRIDAATDQLVQAEGHLAQRRQHHQRLQVGRG